MPQFTDSRLYPFFWVRAQSSVFSPQWWGVYYCVVHIDAGNKANGFRLRAEYSDWLGMYGFSQKQATFALF